MAKGILLAFDEVDLLEIWSNAVQKYKDGETLMSYASDGVSVNKRQLVSVHEALEESGFALWKLDPVKHAKHAPRSRFTAFNHGGNLSR